MNKYINEYMCSGVHTPLHKSYFQVPIASRSVADDKLSYGDLFQNSVNLYTFMIYFLALSLKQVYSNHDFSLDCVRHLQLIAVQRVPTGQKLGPTHAR